MLNILMAVFDFVPVGLFLAAAIMLQRDLYNKMSKGAFAVFASGTIFVFTAGSLKALYKLLYYTGVCDWQALTQCFFPLQTIGFILAGAGLVALLTHKQGEHKAYSLTLPTLIFLAATEFTAPEEFNGTMVFVVLMVIGVLMFDASLIFISAKMKKPLIIVLLAISFVFVLGMGYLSSKSEMSDWIKEIVNTIGQGTLFAAVLLLRKNGLGEENSLTGIAK